MAAPQGQKKNKAHPQKKLRQKVPMQPKQEKQERKKRAGRQMNKGQKNPKQSSSMFVSKILHQLCQGKAPLPAKDKENTVFAQRCFLASRDGQQQCFLSNYVSSQATSDTMDSLNIPMVTAWPCKPTVSRWTTTISPPQRSAMAGQLWPEGQQQSIFSNGAPSQALYGQMSSLGAKELHYEVNDRMPRQSIMCLFTNKYNKPRY